MNILLGLTGSVATTVAHKMVAELQKMGSVKVVLTEQTLAFVRIDELWEQLNHEPETVLRDQDEWTWYDGDGKSSLPWGRPGIPRYDYKKDDPVLHIELRDWADAFVIAPLTANTLAKMANGICDNLLTSVFRAWDFETEKPVIVAPAMNTKMWENHFTKKHLIELAELFSVKIVPPQAKKLACGDEGEGAMADVKTIAEVVQHFGKGTDAPA
jgi:phosphopantothenoylcysteine decarboxylase